MFGPPFGPLTYTAIPIDTYPPQVGYHTPLKRVYQLSSIFFSTEVFVTREGQLVGVVHTDKMFVSSRNNC